MIVNPMENELMEELAKEIAKSRNGYGILKEIEWFLEFMRNKS